MGETVKTVSDFFRFRAKLGVLGLTDFLEGFEISSATSSRRTLFSRVSLPNSVATGRLTYIHNNLT